MLTLSAEGHWAVGGLGWEADRGCTAGGSRLGLGPRVLLAHQGRGLAVSLSSPVFAAQPPVLLSDGGRGHGTPGHRGCARPAAAPETSTWHPFLPRENVCPQANCRVTAQGLGAKQLSPGQKQPLSEMPVRRVSRRGEGWGEGRPPLCPPGPLGAIRGSRGGTPSWCPCPSVWEGSGGGCGPETKETLRQQSGRQTDRHAQPSTASRAGSRSTLYATRAGHFFPSPRGGDMCFSISNMSL